MTDFFIKLIPIPLPRPEMEEIIPGGVLREVKLDIPFNPAEVDLTFPVVGFNWFRMKWNEMNPFSFGFAEDKHGWYNLLIYNNASEVLLFLGALGIIGLTLTVLILSIEKILEKLNIISRNR